VIQRFFAENQSGLFGMLTDAFFTFL